MEKKVRHYQKNDKLVIRTKEDFSESAIKERAKLFDILLDSQIIEPKPANPKIIETADGKLTRIFFTIPDYAISGADNPYWNVYSDLILKLPEHTKLLILTHNSTKQELSDWLNENGLADRADLGSVPDHLNFSVWAEDGYAITREGNKTYFAEPFSFPRYADSLMAEFASNISDLENYQAPLYFQGGNILIGDTFFFIGADYPKNSLQYINQAIFPAANESPTQLIKRLYSEYLDTSKELSYIGSKIPVPTQKIEEITVDGETWRQIVFMGNREGTVQPLFHIDMFISLAGRNSQGKYQILVGDPKMAAEILDFPESLEYAMTEVFDNIADNISKNADFEVIRNPLPLIYTDDTDNKIRKWYFATGNNCLVENYSGNKKVWLPTYAYGQWTELVETDNKNKEIWESLGYTVEFLADFHPFAENLGAVHCIKKYLGRE